MFLKTHKFHIKYLFYVPICDFRNRNLPKYYFFEDISKVGANFKKSLIFSNSTENFTPGNL